KQHSGNGNCSVMAFPLLYLYIVGHMPIPRSEEMKTRILITLAVLLPSISFAKTDFGALIEDNAKVQKQIHSSIKNTLEAEAPTRLEPRQRIVVVEKAGKSINSVTPENAKRSAKRFHR